MSKRLPLFLFWAVLCATTTTQLSAQKVTEVAKDLKTMDSKDRKEGWVRTGGIGTDFSWLNLINPRSGAGDNRIGFGGLVNYSANLTKGKILWDNKFGGQLAAVKIGNDDWTKANDVLQVTSQFGYAVRKNWYAAGIADFQSQILATYGANYLKEKPNTVANRLPISGKFLAPATFKFGPGVIHTPTPNLKIMYSPVAVKAIIVRDDSLSKKGIFFPVTKVGQTTDFQVGSQLRVDFSKKFFNDKIVYSSTLDLYSNYRRNPENIDVEFYNSFDFIITKGISLNFKTDWFYDDDILILRDGNVNNRGKDVFIRNALLLKYTGVF